MTEADKTKTLSNDDHRETMLKNVMLATGLPRETVVELMVSDDDLDALCDAALSAVSEPSKKVAITRE
jgi:hypothetical protein